MIARYNHAIELINEKQQFRNGADELEALAQETKNVTVVLGSMSASNMMAKLDFETENYAGSIHYADLVIDWAIMFSNEEALMNENKEQILNAYRLAQSLKGRAMLHKDMNDSECVGPLEEAVDYGDVEALYWLGAFYTMNNCEPQENIELYKTGAVKAANYWEQYIEKCDKSEDPEKISMICGWLASHYKEGLGVPKDMNKYQYYARLS